MSIIRCRITRFASTRAIQCANRYQSHPMLDHARLPICGFHTDYHRKRAFRKNEPDAKHTYHPYQIPEKKRHRLDALIRYHLWGVAPFTLVRPKHMRIPAFAYTHALLNWYYVSKAVAP